MDVSMLRWRLAIAALVISWSATAGGPMQELWRNDLVNVTPSQLQYFANAVALDSSNSLFVGGTIRLRLGPLQVFPFVAKFDASGTKRWEYWMTSTVGECTRVEDLAGDDRGGAYFAVRNPEGGIRLAWLDYRGMAEELQAGNYGAFTCDRVASVNLCSDHNQGFYLTGITHEDTNSPVWFMTVTRCDTSGKVLWSSNLYEGYLPSSGMERMVAVDVDALYVIGCSAGPYRLTKLNTNGAVEWTQDAGEFLTWSHLAVIPGRAICAAGDRNYQIFSPRGRNSRHTARGDPRHLRSLLAQRLIL